MITKVLKINFLVWGFHNFRISNTMNGFGVKAK